MTQRVIAGAGEGGYGGNAGVLCRPAYPNQPTPTLPQPMDNSLTDIVLVVDESGSMCSLQSAVISSFNGFINEQKEGQGTACVTLYTFSDTVKKTLQACEVREVTPLSEKNYDPHGCTALLDAVGSAIDETGTRLAALPEEKRPGTVIVGIMTDGYENASTRYSWEDIADRISHQKEKYSWHFMFFGADETAIAAAAKLNIERSESALWQAGDAEEVSTVMSAQSRRVRARRHVAMDCADSADMSILSCSLEAVTNTFRRHKRKK